MATYNAGVVTAYGAAVQGGYTGTYEEFCEQQANYANTVVAVEATAAHCDEVADHCDEVLESIPQDYTNLNNEVSDLKSDISELPKNFTSQTIASPTGTNAYINSAVTIGNTVDLTPISFTGFAYYIISCSANDIFTISGVGAGAGRLWSFVDSNNKMLLLSADNVFARDKVIIAPTNAAKLIINVNTSHYFNVIKGDSSKYINTASTLSNANRDNHFIRTGVSAGTTVNLTPEYFHGYTFRIRECDNKDLYLVAGKAGNAGRLWAWLNSSYLLISSAAVNAETMGAVIEAPAGAKYLVVNSEAEKLFLHKCDDLQITNAVKCNLTETPKIVDLPKSQISLPSVEYSHYVQQTTGVSGAKGAIFKDSSDNYCITYGENLDGTGIDIPTYDGSGTLAMKYKYFHYANGSESATAYGEIAKKGTTYTDYQGTTKTMVGGCGLPCGVRNLQFFTTVEELTTNDPLYTFSGITNYGMIPCCCSVTVDGSGVTFGTINELKLVVNGVTGKFDMHRIDANYSNDYSYLTTTPPFWAGTYYMWFQIISNGFARLWSYDGITWTYAESFSVSYQPNKEVSMIAVSGGYYYAARTISGGKFLSDQLYFGKIDASTKQQVYEYRLPFVETRPWLAYSGSEILLFYTPASKQIVECIRVCDYGNREAFFWRWFTIYKNCTWYIAANNESITSNTFDKMYLVGGNSESGSPSGMTFLVLSFDTSKPFKPTDLPAVVI